MDEFLFGDDEPLNKPIAFMKFLKETVDESKLVGLSATVYVEGSELHGMEAEMYSRFGFEHITYQPERNIQVEVN